MKRKTFLKKKKALKQRCDCRKKDILSIEYFPYDKGDKLMGGTVMGPLLVCVVIKKSGSQEDYWI